MPRHPVELRLDVVHRLEGHVEFVGERAASAGCPLGAEAADDDRWMRPLDRLGQRRGVGDGVVGAGVAEGLADGRRPQPGEDVELLGQPLETLAQRREGDGVAGVLGLEPTRSDAESTRPPLISSTWATEMASGPGWRKVADVTMVPSLIVSVSRARPPSVTHESVGPGRPSPLIAT